MIPTVSITTHRGKDVFRWRVNDKPRYRVIESPGNRKAVEQQRAALIQEIMQGPVAKLIRKSLTEHITDWVAVIAAKRGADQAELLERRLRRLLTAIGATTLAAIDVDKIEIALANMTWARSSQPLSEQSKNHYRATIRQFSRWLVRTKRWREGLNITLPKVQHQPGRRDRLQPHEADLLIRATMASTRTWRGFDGPRRAWLYRLALLTGLRRKELAILTPRSFVSGAVVVPASGTKNGEAAVCPLPASCLPELLLWLGEHDVDQVLWPRLASIDTRDLIGRDLVAAELPIRTPEGTRCFHSLRNTYISSLWDLGLPGPLVQGLARHSKMELTSQYNRHLDGARLAAVQGLRVPGASTDPSTAAPRKGSEG